ncbi:MAG: hypothetical protein ACPL7D_09905 [Candidatus Sumerlaeaceae bacterium]|jgi:hypothetical protein
MSRERNERWQGEVTNELLHISERLAGLERRLEGLENHICQLFNQHLDYHTANEHLWGLLRWAQRYPLRFAVLVAGALLWLHAPDVSLVPALVRDVLLRLVR